MNLQEYKRAYPQFSEWDDEVLVNRLYREEGRKAGLSFDDFSKAIGFAPEPEVAAKSKGGFVDSLKTGAATTFKQLPQLGYGLASVGAASLESMVGEGGVATALKQGAVDKYIEWSKKIQADHTENYEWDVAYGKAKEGDINALVDFLGYGIGYGLGQGAQIMASAGVGAIAAKTVGRAAVEKMASGMIAKEVAEIGATEAGKKLAANEVRELAVSNVAAKVGREAALAVSAVGMEGGEIGGDLVAENRNRELTGSELVRALGATTLAGAFEYAGDRLGLTAITGKLGLGKSMAGLGGRAVRGATGAIAAAPGEFATEYMQTGAEEWGKGKEENIVPWNQSAEAQRQAINAGALGAVGGGAMGAIGGAISPPATNNTTPDHDILNAQTADEAIAIAQERVSADLTSAVTDYQSLFASAAPSGSFDQLVQNELNPVAATQLGEDQALQNYLRNTDTDTLVRDLVHADQASFERIVGGLSERAADMVLNDISSALRSATDEQLAQSPGYAAQIEMQRRRELQTEQAYSQQSEQQIAADRQKAYESGQIAEQARDQQVELQTTISQVNEAPAAPTVMEQAMAGAQQGPSKQEQLRLEQARIRQQLQQTRDANRTQAAQLADNEAGNFSTARQARPADGEAAPMSAPANNTENAKSLSRMMNGAPVADVTVQALAGKFDSIPRLMVQTAQKIGKMLGRQVVFFEGGIADGAAPQMRDDKRIFINVKQGAVNPLSILGHEMMHRLRIESPKAYQTLVKAVRDSGIITDEMLADYDADYNSKDYADLSPEQADAKRAEALAKIKSDKKTADFLLEEMLSDLNGNRFTEPDFWTNVFQKIEEREGREAAKPIIARLREALVMAINRLMTAMKTLGKDGKFGADQQVLDHLGEVKSALEEAFATYMQEMKDGGSGQLSVQNAQDRGQAQRADMAGGMADAGLAGGEPAGRGGVPAGAGAADPKAGAAGGEGGGGLRYSGKKAPGSDVGHKRTKSGEYVGAPPGMTASKLGKLRNTLRALIEDGKDGRMWYEESSDAILASAEGDRAFAEKISGLLAIYSPNATVSGNATMGIKALYQWANGEPIKVRFPDQDRKAQAWMDGTISNDDALKIKTGNFHRNLMRKIDEENYGYDKQGATIDMWMARVFGYGSKAIGSEARYYFAERETKQLAKELGWEPQQVQAALWVAIKARVEAIRNEARDIGLKKGWVKEKIKNGNISYEPVNAESREKYEGLILKMALAADRSVTDEFIHKGVYNFATALKERVGQLSWEAMPGKTTGVLPGIFDAPLEQQAEYLAAIDAALRDENGGDLIAKKLDLPVLQTSFGPSAWQMNVGAGAQTEVVIPTDREQKSKNISVNQNAKDLLNTYAAIRGYVLAQEAVVWHYPIFDAAKKNANGVQLDFGRDPTHEEVKALYQAIYEASGRDDWAPAYVPGVGVRVLNFSDVPNTEFHKLVQQAANKLEAEIKGRTFKSDGDYVGNDWAAAPQGEQYKEIINASSKLGTRGSGRSDLQGWVESELRPRVERVNQEFSDKYGWGKAKFSLTRSDAGSAQRAGAVAAEGGGEVRSYGTAAPGAIAVQGFHYSTAERSQLDGRYYGTGTKGAEYPRVMSSRDPRIKERIYFYVDAGRGITPEQGVGSVGHTVNLNNVYDGTNDTWLQAKISRDLKGDEWMNAFESAVIDNGFDGYVSDFGTQRAAVLLGRHSVKVQPTQATSGSVAESKPAQENAGADAVAKSRVLPGGKMSGADWKRMVPAVVPGADVSMLEDGKDYYKDDVVAAMRGVKYSLARSVESGNGLPNQSDGNRTLDWAELKTLRRAAANLERPRDGVFLRVTEDGKAIATGPKGTRVPDRFIRFAEENGLAFEARRDGRGRQTAGGYPMGGDITSKTEPMPAKYRESGAMYFGEGNVFYDRTGMSRFSLSRTPSASAQKEIAAIEGRLAKSPSDFVAKNLENIKRGLAGEVVRDEKGNLLAPNGRKSKLTEQQYMQVRTPEFMNWFGDWLSFHNAKNGNGVWEDDAKSVSKVVDENGEPMVVYHGSEKGGFRYMRPEKGDKHRSPMIFAAKTRDTARSYSGRGDEIDLNTGLYEDADGYDRDENDYDQQRGVYSLFLNIRNPNESDFEKANWDGQRIDSFRVLDENGDPQTGDDGTTYMSQNDAEALAESLGDGFEVVEEPYHYETTNSVAEEAKRYGNDGAIIRNVIDDGGRGGHVDPDDVFVIFDSNQAKSATQNVGTFSTTNDDLRYSLARAWKDFAKNEDVFQFPKSDKASLPDIMSEVAPGYSVKKLSYVDDAMARDFGVVEQYRIMPPNQRSSEAMIYVTPNKVWINASQFKVGVSGGSRVYAAMLNFAHNNMIKMIGDPLGVSEIATFRRTENMLSAALKFGTTDFMEPSKTQAKGKEGFGGVIGNMSPLRWVENDDQHNLESLIKTSYENVVAFVPEIKDVIYSRELQDFVRAEQPDRVVAQSEWDRMSRRLLSGLEGISEPGEKLDGYMAAKSGQDQRSATLKRAGITNTFLREEGEEGRGSLLAPQSGELPGRLEGVLYSTRRIVGQSRTNYTAAQRQAFLNAGREITEEGLVERTLKYLKNDFAKKMATGIVDQFRGLRDLNDGGQAYMLARLSKGTAGAFDALLHHGKLSIRDGAYDADTTGGFVDRLGVALNGELDDFLWYVAGNRAEKLKAEGRERLMSDSDIAALKSLSNGTTSFDYMIQTGPGRGQVTRDRTKIFADANRVFNEFQKNVLDMAEQSGLIDGSTRKFWESEFYVPFYRISEEDGEFIGAKMGKALVRQKAFHKLKGGTDKLNSDILSNTLLNFSHLIEASAKNRAAKAALTAAEQVGAARKALPGETKTVWYAERGQKVEYKVDDPFVMTAITSLEYAGMRNPIMNALSTFKHWLTVGVTASPAFKVRNLIRDSVQAIGTSDLSYNPITNVVTGFKQTKRDSQEYVSALASGGLIRFGTMLEGSESKRVRQLIRSGVKDSSILTDEGKWQAFYDKFLEPGITAYNELGNRSEEINRAALYNQLIAQGKTHAEAALMARDLMDFSMQGSFNTIRFLSQVVPFLNARLQGMYKLGRSAKDNPRKMAIVTGAVALASIALMLAYDDDEDWKRREDWDRDGFWWFKFGGIEWRIPKPFEIGAVATLAERGLEYMINDEMTGERFRKVTKDLVMNNLSMNPVPQMMKPIIDLYANKDSFTDRPIETMSMQRLDPTMRYTSNTSMTARAASKAMLGALSPVQIDHLVRGYFGWLGGFVNGGADMAWRAMSDEPTKPALDYWKFATQGILKEQGTGSSRYVTMVYDQAKELEEAHATYRQLLKDGKMDDAKEYAEDNADKLRRYRQVESVKKAESRLNERIRTIERSNMQADEKKDLIAAIQKQKEDVAKRIAPGLQ